MTGRRVLWMGLDPYTVDFQSDFFRGRAANADVIADGLKVEYLLIDARAGAKAASTAAHAALVARPVDVVVIGGARVDPAQTPMLEALVNAVIEAAPRARVAFNTLPTESQDIVPVYESAIAPRSLVQIQPPATIRTRLSLILDAPPTVKPNCRPSTTRR